MTATTNSTNTPIASRRRLGAGLLTIKVGSVITSGVAAAAAASVGDLAQADTDAELIAACTRFNEIERQ